MAARSLAPVSRFKLVKKLSENPVIWWSLHGRRRHPGKD
eukprot:COSAG05_NODE_2023_length_3681_cov_2.114182_1_plen_38_part_10